MDNTSTPDGEEFPRITAYELVEQVADRFAPPNRITVAEAAEKYMFINTPGGYSGYWNKETTPYMIEPMNLTTSRDIHTVVFAGAARTGKTQGLLEGVLTYSMTCDPCDTLIVHMTEASARKYSRIRIKRLLEGDPTLKAKMSKVAHDDNVLSKYFKDGTSLQIGWPAPSQLSGMDYRTVMISDYDRIADDTGEGSVYALAMKRTQTFGSSGICVVESSPGRDFTDPKWEKAGHHQAPPLSGILGLYNMGDRRLMYWKCPHCEERFVLYPGLDLFNLPSQDELILKIRKQGAKEVAKEFNRIVCPNHGCIIDVKHKNEMNMSAVWIAESDKPNAIASFWQSGLCAKFQSWLSLLEKEFSALELYASTGIEEELKTTRNTDQGIPYIPMSAANRMSFDYLEARAEPLAQRMVPKGCRFLIGSADVQATKFVCQVEGYGVNNERWLIDRFDITEHVRRAGDESELLDPAGYKEDWDALLPALINKQYELDDDSGREMGLIMVTCDSGGKEGVTENAYSFWKRCKELRINDRFSLIKGERPKPNANAPAIREVYPDKTSSAARAAKVAGQMPLWILNTTLLKDAVMANLKRDEKGSDYVHFPDWLETWFFGEVTAEYRDEKGWHCPSKKRNEAFDLMVYSKAALMIKLKGYWKKTINWDKPPAWAAEWDKNEMVFGKSAKVETTTTKPKRKLRQSRMRIKR